ncbi:hypothetical protein B6U67_00720 [Methanosarcinales archaeon ex4484_138]|nr:MAG: hypothetical protein B6U67_00720 [Methanosarcinales archaeon ex4484_138]
MDDVNELREKIAYMLATAYRRVDWKKMGSRSAYDVFAHRVKVAGYMNTVAKFVEKLCHGLHLQSINIDPDELLYLEEKRDEALRMLREETVLLVLMAAKKAKELKINKKFER